MKMTKSFPPADDLIAYLKQVDYVKHYNNFMDAVVVFCVYVAVIATVIRNKWQENDCTERLQLFALKVADYVKIAYAWIVNVFIPECKSFYSDTCSLYNTLKLNFV